MAERKLPLWTRDRLPVGTVQPCWSSMNSIDPETGALELVVKGIRGQACQDVAKLVVELIGKPAVDRTTSEYYLRPRVHPRIHPKTGQ